MAEAGSSTVHLFLSRFPLLIPGEDDRKELGI